MLPPLGCPDVCRLHTVQEDVDHVGRRVRFLDNQRLTDPRGKGEDGGLDFGSRDVGVYQHRGVIRVLADERPWAVGGYAVPGVEEAPKERQHLEALGDQAAGGEILDVLADAVQLVDSLGAKFGREKVGVVDGGEPLGSKLVEHRGECLPESRQEALAPHVQLSQAVVDVAKLKLRTAEAGRRGGVEDARRFRGEEVVLAKGVERGGKELGVAPGAIGRYEAVEVVERGANVAQRHI
ncbi:FAA hydrolase family protein [Babesia caballi]|uniref:FAA hydrolase family protein n=1 Tax=Babesia caballi TaxID=5871 RepID=A0AAV4M1J9_BABCB|nr:FAA hydrolase family protein [Babesia caballi]